MQPNQQPNVVVATGSEPVAASDIARSDPNYNPSFGAHGTAGETPPGDSTNYTARENQAAQTVAQTQPPADINAPAIAPGPPIIQDVTPPSAVASQPVPTPAPAPAPQAVGDPGTRIGNLEGQVNAITDQLSNLATLVAGVAQKLDTAVPSPIAGPEATRLPQVPVATTDLTPVNGSNTGNYGGGVQTPAVAAPLAPTPHAPGVQAPVAPSAPVDVIPTPVAPISEQKVRAIPEDEGNLTVGEYIEKHFRQRDRSIDQMALELRMEPSEVTSILKELGYQFPDGV